MSGRIFSFLFLAALLVYGCTSNGNETSTNEGTDSRFANVLGVQVSGEPGAYQFSVQVRSLDTGCPQYADWWEVVTTEGELLYRRVLLHSHTNEQPFTRSGGSVEVQSDQRVIVRAHMNTTGYGGQALQGSPSQGFRPIDLPAGFAADLAEEEPLPEGCAF